MSLFWLLLTLIVSSSAIAEEGQWRQISPRGCPVCAEAAAPMGDDVFVYCHDGSAIYSPKSNSWKAVSRVNAPKTRESIVPQPIEVMWTADKIVVLAERSNTEPIKRHIIGSTYDPRSDTWTMIDDSKPPMSHESMHPLRTVAATTQEVVIASDGKIYRFSPAGNTWQVFPSTLPNTDVLRAVSGNDRQVYFLSQTDFFKLDIKTNNLSALPTHAFPGTGFIGLSLVWAADKLLVWDILDHSISGHIKGFISGLLNWHGGGTGFTNSGRLFDPKTKRWTKMTTKDAPFPRVTGNSIVKRVGDRLLAWHVQPSQTDINAYSNAFIYDPNRDEWSQSAAGGPQFYMFEIGVGVPDYFAVLHWTPKAEPDRDDAFSNSLMRLKYHLPEGSTVCSFGGLLSLNH